MAGIVVAIDVDGVLNPLPGRRDLAANGFGAHELLLPADVLPDSPLIRGYGLHDLMLTVHVNPVLHGGWINRLLATPGIEPVWATTWERAVALLEPLLCLATPLPIVEFSRSDVGALHGPRIAVGDVKQQVLWSLFRDRHLVWVDDLVAVSVVARAGPGDIGGWHRHQHVDPFAGLTPNGIEEVDAFLGWVAAQPVAST